MKQAESNITALTVQAACDSFKMKVFDRLGDVAIPVLDVVKWLPHDCCLVPPDNTLTCYRMTRPTNVRF